MRERKRRVWWENFAGEALMEVVEWKNEILNRPVLSYRFVGP